MARLDGQTALIVGGTGGIGLAAARRFLDEGARVCITGVDQTSTDYAARILDRPGEVSTCTLDVLQPDDVEAMTQAAIEFGRGRLDILLHVAGLSGRRFGDGTLESCTSEGWDLVMDVNAKGVFLTNQVMVRQMLTQELDAFGLRGSIVNVGSVLAAHPSPTHFGTIAYSASKGAVRAMTLTSASRYAQHRIRFNLLCPGLIDTPMSERAIKDVKIQAYLQTKQPMTNGPGSTADVAEAALFLCEPSSRFVTGVVLNVDGGWSISEGNV